MMNASYINSCVHDNAGWEDFESALFQAGNVELPRLLADQFGREFSAWLNDLDRMIQKYKHPEMPTAGDDFSHDTENVVSALKYLVHLQGNEISARNKDGSFACSFLVADRLEAAFDKAWNAYCDLLRPLDGGKIPQAA